MPKPFTVHGVPASIATDAWWLTIDANNNDQGAGPKGGVFDDLGHWAKGLGGMIVLIVLGDYLFWDARPGFSLALFALAIFGATAASQSQRGNISKPTVLMILSTAPVIEHVQFLSLCILIIGGICALGWLRINTHDSPAWIAAAAMKLIRSMPVSGVLSFLAALSALRVGGAFEGFRAGLMWRNWAFPIGGALILGSLLISANPVLEQLVARLFTFETHILPSIDRIMFWIGLALVVWPLINPPAPQRPFTTFSPARRINIGLNCGSVLRALMLFNAFLLVQSILDVSILLAGADLPENMTYATYAHRGAYPLLATAMLAGAFTFAARPFLEEHRWIKPLLLMWVAQNVLLTFSSVLRLELYISEYGLTYLRIYALIWMGLVAIGLVVVLWHVLRNLPSLMLLARLAILGFGTLYLCAFVNFAAIIATHTLARAADPENRTAIDWTYLCALGPTAHQALLEGLVTAQGSVTERTLHSCHFQGNTHRDWRELDYRTLRTRGYLSR